MLPEQIPGTLFVLILTLLAWSIGAHLAMILLAVGCAFGWAGMSADLDSRLRNCLTLIALAFWLWALILLTLEIL